MPVSIFTQRLDQVDGCVDVVGAIPLSHVSNELRFVSVTFGLTDHKLKAITRAGTPPFYKRNMPLDEITQVAQRQAPYFGGVR